MDGFISQAMAPRECPPSIASSPRHGQAAAPVQCAEGPLCFSPCPLTPTTPSCTAPTYFRVTLTRVLLLPHHQRWRLCVSSPSHLSISSMRKKKLNSLSLPLWAPLLSECKQSDRFFSSFFPIMPMFSLEATFFKDLFIFKLRFIYYYM